MTFLSTHSIPHRWARAASRVSPPCVLRGEKSAADYRRKAAYTLLLLNPLFLLGFAGGCGGKGRLPVNPVHGRVIYRGQGVPQAVVIFFPADDVVEKAKKLRPFAYADGQGNFDVKTYVDGDGAPPGKYRVSIIAVSSGSGGGRTKDKPPGEVQNSPAQAVMIPPAVTEKYRNIDTSGIEVTVEKGENNLDPFVLTMGTGNSAQAATSSSATSSSSKN